MMEGIPRGVQSVATVPLVGNAATDGQVAKRLMRVEHIMGTAIRIELSDGGPVSVLDEVFDWFREVDARFSLYRADSEMSRLARGDVREADVHEDIRAVLELCEEVRIRSGGTFDAARHRPDGLLDPTGLVKGWSVDRAGLILTGAGVVDWSINAGGDILTHGRPAPGEPWRVGIQHPLRRDAIAAVVSGTDMAVATSGTYERGRHIVDPFASERPGQPELPAQLLSVTVVGPALTFADAYATAAFAMGGDAARWIASIPDYEGGVITSAERVIWTAGMDRYLDRS